MTRAKRATQRAAESSRRVVAVVQKLSKTIDESGDGIPIAPLSDDDSLVTTVSAIVERHKRSGDSGDGRAR